MKLPNTLVKDLRLLSAALDDPLIDLEAILSVLTDDLTAAVPGYLGLTLTLQVEDGAVIITTLHADTNRNIRASLHLPLSPTGGSAAATSSMVFFSAASGSFVDLAADARWIFPRSCPPLLDTHLTAPAARADPTVVAGLAELSDINQALGALIDQGRTPENARVELRRRAIREGLTMPAVARTLLAALAHPGPRPATNWNDAA